MDSQQVIEKLGYSDNPAFLQGERLREHHGYSFLFSQAEREERCNLKGVYTLAPPGEAVSNRSLTPVVYVCEADNEALAHKIHKRVWNQNIVPFLIVVTPKNVRLYSGFEYGQNQTDERQVLAVAERANALLDRLSAFTSESIDSGDIWRQRPISVEGRVDRHLLRDLEKLSEVLTGPEYKLPPKHAHTLIGKYIYLKYLRDRGILSDHRLSDAGVSKESVFSRTAEKDALYQLEGYLDGFLNGSVFPLPDKKIQTKHVAKVAAVFNGDNPESGQQFLFDMYDFSYVPIETLSVVYQQFLHQKGEGRSKGAYYTPVHLVNFMLDELEAKKPLKEGMRVFDPSCGSGAFLVQCYRRLVESVVRTDGELRPTKLRSLLTKHIFGLDADEAACRVAQLSLSLTLLDYIDPPDLSKTNFKLPDLHNQNIFHCKGGFFDDDSLWAKSQAKQSYHWIVGNPPWKNIDKKKDKEPRDLRAIEWIEANKDRCPVDNYQTAEAFAWKTTELLTEDGQCGFLMPAMTLFKKQADRFRAKFFSNTEVWCVVNFANIRRYLFENAINPSAAFFYSGNKDWDKANHYITTYAPFAVEQSSQLNQRRRSKTLWALLVTYSSIKEIPLRAVGCGSTMPWKTAMWGTYRDGKLVELISKNSLALEDYLAEKGIDIAEGSQLRDLPAFDTQKDEESFYKAHKYCRDLVNKWKVDAAGLKKSLQEQEVSLEFPHNGMVKIKEGEAYLRKRGGEAGLAVSRPPHIIIAASRRYILYSNRFLVVPPRQIGISGDRKQESLLKSLTLFLNSNFVAYQQLLTGESLGVERDRVNLDSFKRIPVRFSGFSEEDFLEWSKLYDEIVEAGKGERENRQDTNTLFSNYNQKYSPRPLSSLLEQMNDKVYTLLGIGKKQRWLIEDMLGVRLKLNDGRIAREATRAASQKEILEFARIFQDELDLFLDHSGKKKLHKVQVFYADASAVMIVDHLKRSTAGEPQVKKVEDGRIRDELDGLGERLTKKRSQWMYFTRCLRIYEGRRTYIFKPRQRLYWLKSQALAEADEFIAEKLATD